MTQAAVVGCGIMGSGITFVARAAGFPVTAVEPTDELLAAARQRVERLEAQARKRGAELEGLAPLEMTTAVGTAVASADVVVEATQDVVAAIDHSHEGTKAREDARKLQRDIATALDQDTLRQFG